MTRHITMTFILTSLILCAGCATTDRQSSLPLDRTALAGVRSIYLGDFGSGEGSSLVREKLRVRLLTSGRFDVVESPERADGVLTGAAGVNRRSDEGTTKFQGTGLLRLVDTKTQKTIWAHEYQRGFMFGGSVSSRVADQMADQLLQDARAQK